MIDKAYLDTCIVSGLAKEDLPTAEQEALGDLLAFHKKKQIDLVTSVVTQEELKKIPPSARRRHEIIYNLLTDVPLTRAKIANTGLLLMRAAGGTIEDPLYTELKKILPDENDALHVFQAMKSGCIYFVTTDRKTILKHRTKVFLKFSEFMTMSPVDMVTLISAPL